jgi:hypothetical protein
MAEDAPASASRAGRTPTDHDDGMTPDEAYETVVAHVDTYETAEARQAFATAAMAMHMALTDGRLPGQLGLRQAAPPDRQ